MIYLDNAATSFPKPPAVVDAVCRQLTNIGGNAGRSSHQGGIASGRVLYETRCALSKLIHCQDPLEINFTLNATEGLNTVIQGALQAGDHVVTTSMEHNSVLRPLQEMKKNGVTHTVVWGDEEGYVNPDDIEKAFTPATRLLIVNHCSNVTGTLQPLEELVRRGKKHQLDILVDASQSCGNLPIDVEALQIDYLVAPGHKALFGPQGTGFLYITKKKKIRALKQGGTGSLSEELSQPETIPDYYESGTQNIHGLAGLKAGIDFILEHGVEEIHCHEKKLTQALWEGLSTIQGIELFGPPPGEQRGSVIAFRGKDLDVNQLNYLLDLTYGIASRSGLHCAPLAHKTLGTFPEGTLRFSPGYFTTTQDIQTVLMGVASTLKQFT